MRDDTLGKAEIITPRLRLRRFSMQDMSGFLLFAADADTMLRAVQAGFYTSGNRCGCYGSFLEYHVQGIGRR